MEYLQRAIAILKKTLAFRRIEPITHVPWWQNTRRTDQFENSREFDSLYNEIEKKTLEDELREIQQGFPFY
jgi:hypothetical protein